MKTEIIEILNKKIELSLTGHYKSAYIDGIDNAADEILKLFEEKDKEIERLQKLLALIEQSSEDE